MLRLYPYSQSSCWRNGTCELWDDIDIDDDMAMDMDMDKYDDMAMDDDDHHHRRLDDDDDDDMDDDDDFDGAAALDMYVKQAESIAITDTITSK